MARVPIRHLDGVLGWQRRLAVKAVPKPPARAMSLIGLDLPGAEPCRKPKQAQGNFAINYLAASAD